MNIILLFLGCGLLDGGVIDRTCEDLPAGCDGSGTTSTTVDPIGIAVDSVEPVYGSSDGGESVIIQGGPFAADVTVLFDGEEAELRTWRENELRVITPPGGADGWVDVTVTTSAGTGMTSQAYRYFDDATGKTAMVGMVEYVHQTGPLASLGDVATGRMGFITPLADASWVDTIADDWDSCRSNWGPDQGWQPLDPGASSLQLVSAADGSTTLTLAWDSAEQFFNGIDGTGSLPADTATPGSLWDVDSFDGTQLPDFGLDSLVQIPDAFVLTSPDLDSTSLTVASSDLSLTWPADSYSDGLYMSLRLVDISSGSELEEVTCLVTDDGAFTVPASSFGAWAAGQTLYIKVGRLQETFSILPLNNGDTRILAAYSVVGAATTQ